MANPLVYLQNTFDGGMNQQVDGSRVAANEYPLLINGRHRNDVIEQVNSPIDRTPTGITNVQGLYAAGSYSVLFADGRAYYRDENLADSVYARIDDFVMSSAVDILYACAVPSSSMNSSRKLASSTNISGGVVRLGQGTSTPQALVVQDGVNQPWVIFPDGTARVLGVYNNWTPEVREYVPIGKQMIFHDGVLYIVAADGSQIYRSVTGRPLDFMVVIDENGNKLPKESDGGAASVSFKVDYAPITAIGVFSSPDGSFYVSTARTSYVVTPDFTQTIYGEPQFKSTFLFTTGAVNNFSFCDVLGDTAIVDYSGIRSFNSVSQYRFEGKNSPFSARVSGLLGNLKQTSPAAITHDNYALFFVNTVFGAGILVFDTITNRWASLDLLSSLSSSTVKMFCEVKTIANRKLLCATSSKVFELYPSTGTQEFIGYYSPEFNSNDPKISQKATYLTLGFVGVTTSGSVFVQAVADGKLGVRKVGRIRNVSLTNFDRAVPPVVHGSKDAVRNVSIPLLDTAKSCWKFGAYIRWSFKGSLNSVKLLTNPEESTVSIEEQAAASTVEDIYISAVLSGFLVSNGIVDILGTGFNCISSITVNGYTVSKMFIQSDTWVRIILPFLWSGGSVPLIVTVVSCSGSSYTWGLTSADSDLPVDNTDFGLWVGPEHVGEHEEDPIGFEKKIIDWKTKLPQDPPYTPQCTATISFDETKLSAIDMSNKGLPTAYILDLTSYLPQPTSINFVGLYFNKNADGTYKFVSPLVSGRPLYPTDPALALIGNSYGKGSGVIPFGFGGFVFCVDFMGHSDITPTPPIPPWTCFIASPTLSVAVHYTNVYGNSFHGSCIASLVSLGSGEQECQYQGSVLLTDDAGIGTPFTASFYLQVENGVWRLSISPLGSPVTYSGPSGYPTGNYTSASGSETYQASVVQ